MHKRGASRVANNNQQRVDGAATHTHTQIMRHRIKQPVKQPHASLNLKVYRWDIGHYQEAALALGHHAVLTRARKLGRPYRQ
jgi:hypothetical protein